MINTIVSIWGENMLGYLPLDIICSSKLTVSLELHSRKTVRFSEQIMYADKYPSTFSRQMEAIVYIYVDIKPNCTHSVNIIIPLHMPKYPLFKVFTPAKDHAGLEQIGV